MKEVLRTTEYEILKEARRAQIHFPLRTIPLERYFEGMESEEPLSLGEMKEIAAALKLLPVFSNLTACVEKGEKWCVSFENAPSDEILECYAAAFAGSMRSCRERHAVHVTRMFGSYMLLRDTGEGLRAVRATPIPIDYCPLMAQLLKEVGGKTAEELLDSLGQTDTARQTERMCDLINEVVIRGGYFDTGRPLNSCEVNVLFGASETIASAFRGGLVDAAVIVSNDLGTIITTNAENTQGAVKRMTGLFYTSPSKEIVSTAEAAGIIPVFPYSAAIDQLEGVREAIRRGYKRIVVSLAAADNILWEEVCRLERDNDVVIYRLGLCSTGIEEKAARLMAECTDLVWACASKWVRELVDPASILQVGIKIPVYVMTERGWSLSKNHLSFMDPGAELDGIVPVMGDERPVLAHSGGKIRCFPKKELRECRDCPHPCV